MPELCFLAAPYCKEEVLLALEAGADSFMAAAKNRQEISQFARTCVVALESAAFISLCTVEDEAKASAALQRGELVVLRRGWEVIPVENLLARAQTFQTGTLALEVANAQEAGLAVRILERGADMVLVSPPHCAALGEIAAAIKGKGGHLPLDQAAITEITPVGLGHRVCVDTLSLLEPGQGMLVGNSAAFTFLVQAETAHNAYVASRPFRINAGAVHAYAHMPCDTTAYLGELAAGDEVLIVNHQGTTATAVVGRVKIEKRPMLLIKATCKGREGAVFVQNAETIRLVLADGTSKSVVNLAQGDRVLCRLDTPGRHFGLRISETICEE